MFVLGWIIVAALVIVLLSQSATFREASESEGDLSSEPRSVIIIGSEHAAASVTMMRELVKFGHDVVLLTAPGTSLSAAAFADARTENQTAAEVKWSEVSDIARHDTVVIFDARVEIDAFALHSFVATYSGNDARIILPRESGTTFIAMITAPLRKFYASMLPHGRWRVGATVPEHVVVATTKEWLRDGADERRVRLADLPGVTLAASDVETLTRRMVETFGLNTALALTTASVILFVMPVILLLTMQFPFVVATLLGIWLRLRSDVRSGGTRIEYALFNALAIAASAVLLARSK